MKKIYRMCLLALTFCTVNGWSQPNSKCQSPQKNLISYSVVKASEQAPTADELVIVDEEFSGLTKGTEDKPDTESLLDSKGFIIDQSLFKPFASSCSHTWGGHSAYSAGGCIALTNGGFLNTPTGDYSGKLRMTCRIRLLSGQTVANPSLDLLLCRRSAFIDFKRITVQLTDQWQEFTLEADNGSYEDTMIQFFTMENFTYLVDDIKIVHTINSIAAPEAIEPKTLADNKFKARWTLIPQATEYLLSVYSKQESAEKEVISEGFDEINSMNNGTEINELNANYPQDWIISVMEFGNKRHLFNEEGYYSSGKQSVCLDAEGDYLETPRLKDPINKMSLWIKVDDREQDANKASTSLLEVEALTDNGWSRWVEISVQAVRDLENSCGLVDISEHIPALKAIYGARIKRSYGDGDNCLIGIDDVTLEAPGKLIRKFFMEDFAVKGDTVSSYDVTVNDPDLTYYYTVKSKNDQFTSKESNEIEVFDVHEPIALDATQVTADSYTANWQCGPKADYFRLDQFYEVSVKEDQQEFVILDEDFSKVKSTGTAESPEEGQYTETYVPIDQYTKTEGWTATSYSLADGMLGGMIDNYPYLAGAIRTPQIDMSNNSGTCKVSIRLYATEGDYIVIAGTNPYTTTNSIYFEKTGFMEETIELWMCSDQETFTIYSGNYMPFMIDYIKITQSLKAGDSVKYISRSVQIDDPKARSFTQENVKFPKDNTLKYQVTAFRYYHGDQNNIWQSAPSNAVAVDVKSSLTSELADRPYQIVSISKGIDIILEEESDVKIYDMTGRQIRQFKGQSGHNCILLNENSIYLIYINNYCHKVLVD